MIKNKERSWFFEIIELLKNCKVKMLLSIILSICSLILYIMPFYIVYLLLNSLFNGVLEYQMVLTYSFYILLFYVLHVVCSGVSTILSHISAYTILKILRESVIKKFIKAPMGNVRAYSIGEIKNMVVDNIGKLEPPIAHVVPEVSGNFVLPVVIFIWLFTIDFRLALSLLAPAIITLIPIYFLTKGFNKKYEKYVKANDCLNSSIVEYVEGIEVIKAFSKTESAYKKYSNAIESFRDFVMDWMKSTWIPYKLSFAIFPSTLLLVLPVGLFLYTRSIITPSELCLAILLSLSAVKSLARIEVFLNEVKSMSYTTKNIKRFLDMKELDTSDRIVDFKNWNINYKDVSFSYDGKKEKSVINKFNLELKQKSFTALVGPSGGGKSTIAKLTSRYWDVGEGSISIGGNNIKKIPIKQLENIISYVSQDNFLFNTTIKENIKLGKIDATDSEIIEAAKKASVHETIMNLDNGYDTNVGEAGDSLSGGERQRITIARMILKDSPIIILDEATAYSDPENERIIQKSLSVLTKNKTFLVIAHRLSTIKNANNIVLLENGSIRDMGTQEELLLNSKLYQKMWKSHIGSKNISSIKGEKIDA